MPPAAVDVEVPAAAPPLAGAATAPATAPATATATAPATAPATTPRARRCCSSCGPPWLRTAYNVALLGLGWTFAAAGMFVQISATTLALAALRPGTPLATLAAACFLLTAAASLVPLSLLAARWGRLPVFFSATALAAGGAALQLGAAYAAARGRGAGGSSSSSTNGGAAPFAMLIAGAALQGPSFATANNYRFSAAEFVDSPRLRPRAISGVVCCAALAAALGPEAALATAGAVSGVPNAGSYAYLVALYAAQAAAVLLVDWRLLRERQAARAQGGAAADARRRAEEAAPLAAAADAEAGRAAGGDAPLKAAAVPPPPPPPRPPLPPPAAATPPPATPYRQLLLARDFVVASLCCAGAFAAMAAMMGATPLEIVGSGLGADVATKSVEAHVLAMYLPALVAGDVVRVLGVAPPLVGGFLVSMAGTLAFLGGDAAPPASAAPSFFAGMVLIGVGWSAAYVAASSLAASCYAAEPPARRLPVQAALDTGALLLVGFALGTASPLMRAGGFGWPGVVGLYAAINGALALLGVWWGLQRRRRRRRRRGSAASGQRGGGGGGGGG
jgi:hypothetical protein